ncbi:MAG: M13-type metalloendopeptidase [Actinomycetes bacterium]
MKSGIDTSNIDPAVRPQDDLFRHMNGTWLTTAQIPADRAADGAFYWLRDESEKKVREIIETTASAISAPGSVAQKIGDLYRSFMDEKAAEQLGISPITADLAKVGAITNASEFLTLLGQLEEEGLGGLFYGFITTDNKKSDENIMYLGQSGLSLPDEAYYREDEYAPIRNAFVAHVEKMFALASLPNGGDHAQRILELESQLASHHWDQVRDRDATLTYNKFSFAQLEELSTGFDWAAWNKGANVPEHILASIVVRQPSFFTGLGEMIKKFDLEKWRSWLLWQVLSGAASYLNSALVNENFDFYGTTLSGVPELKERWKRGVGLVEGALGEAVGQLYVEKHFPPQAKKRMEQLVANLIEAYRVDISALDWMSAETKVKALEKLDKFTPKIGYPDKWKDYSTLQITAGDLIANLTAVSAFARAYEFNKIGKPVDRSEWYMTPQTVNAYYNPGMNEIVFPAAILQPPFFDLDSDDAANYGGIGAVIGHEIGHGFDDQGAKYDGDGNLNDWWSDSDRIEFEKRSKKLIDQYEALVPEETPDSHVNGALTIGENIGDLGGLTIAHKAYEISLGGSKAPDLDGFSGYQRLFLGWAQVWRSKVRPEETKRRLATDPHSPAEFRCNQVIANLNEFYEAFGVTAADAIWLAPDQRVRIW